MALLLMGDGGKPPKAAESKNHVTYYQSHDYPVPENGITWFCQLQLAGGAWKII